MSPPFPHLFQPIRIGSKQSRNRIMRLATSTNTGENGIATDRTIACYGSIARGGTGIIVTEGMRAHSSSAASRVRGFLLFRKEIVPSLARLADAVHAEGALLIAQANEGGRQHQGANIPAIMWGPSAIACPHSGGIPHEMSKAEIAEVVVGFATAALHAKQAGCDGVEIHGAQGHLIQEFVSAFSNQREDEYGGNLENRLRFTREIISSVREKVGADFIVGYRMGYEEFTPGGITVEESKLVTAQLLKLGMLDYLSLAQGNFNSIDTHCPDSHYPPLPFIDLQAQIKAVAGSLPIVASARIQTPEQAESILAAGKADLVGMCRALIADPEWPLKAMQGRSEDIRRCIGTSQCWGTEGTATRSNRLSCEINPTVGYELELPPLVKVAAPRRVVIVGGGPAGLEAAHTAAERGHQVVLFEKTSRLGGKLAYADRYAAYHEVFHAIEFLSRQVAKSGVTVRLGTQADAQAVLAEKPDAVIVATGATVMAPPLAGDGSVAVQAYIPENFPDGAIVVMDEDGYYWAASVTEELARQGRNVTYVTRFMEPLRELPKVSRISTLRALDELDVTCYDNMYVECANKGAVVVRHAYNGKRRIRIENVRAVLWLGVQRVNDSLLRELRDLGVKDVHVVGDAYAPRRLANAIAEGHRAARAI